MNKPVVGSTWVTYVVSTGRLESTSGIIKLHQFVRPLLQSTKDPSTDTTPAGQVDVTTIQNTNLSLA